MKTCIILHKDIILKAEIKRKALKNFKTGSAGERPLRLGLKFKPVWMLLQFLKRQIAILKSKLDFYIDL